MTRIFLDKAFVIFGILHLIGISIILAYPFLKLRYWNLLIGVLCIFLGAYLKGFTFDFYWLSWLGFRPAQFYSVDYSPLLPWFGVVLIGIFFGNLLYSDQSRRFQLVDLSFFSGIKVFCFLGKHSLLIYLLHQPLIIAVFYLLGMANMNLLKKVKFVFRMLAYNVQRTAFSVEDTVMRNMVMSDKIKFLKL